MLSSLILISIFFRMSSASEIKSPITVSTTDQNSTDTDITDQILSQTTGPQSRFLQNQWRSKSTKTQRQPIYREITTQETPTEDELKFDTKYFESLNAKNHRPVVTSESETTDQPLTSPIQRQPNQTTNVFYYSPEIYGKKNFQNHQNSAYKFSYPGRGSVGDQDSVNTVQPQSETAKSGDPKRPDEEPEEEETRDDDEESYMFDQLADKLEADEILRQQKSNLKLNSIAVRKNADHDEIFDYVDDYEMSESAATPSRKSRKRIVIKEPPPFSFDEQLLPTGLSLAHRLGPYTPIKGSYLPHRFDLEKLPSKAGLQTWSGLAGFLLGVIPLGLLMASMVPAFVSVPVATATATGKRRKRDINKLSRLMTNGGEQLKIAANDRCLKLVLCQIAGELDGDLFTYRLGKIIEMLGESSEMMKMLNINELTRVARKDQCHNVYKC